MADKNEILMITVIAVCTFATRLFPFAVFGRGQQPSGLVKYLGKSLPAAVIAILIVYCIKTINFAVISTFAPQFIAIAIVIALHIWKRNNLISIGIGTVIYMVLVQFVFV
jgi:branched-subunit amino acid transport protein AzlD